MSQEAAQSRKLISAFESILSDYPTSVHKIRAVFQGHCHQFSHFRKDGIDYFTTAGFSRPWSNFQWKGAKKLVGPIKQDEGEFHVYSENVHQYMTMEIDSAAGKIVYSGLRLADNSVFYRFEADVTSS